MTYLNNKQVTRITTNGCMDLIILIFSLRISLRPCYSLTHLREDQELPQDSFSLFLVHYLVTPRNSPAPLRMIVIMTRQRRGRLQVAMSSPDRSIHAGDQLPFAPQWPTIRISDSYILPAGFLRWLFTPSSPATPCGRRRVGAFDEKAQRLNQLIQTHVSALLR